MKKLNENRSSNIIIFPVRNQSTDEFNINDPLNRVTASATEAAPVDKDPVAPMKESDIIVQQQDESNE